MTILVIGAGMAGLTAAHDLVNAGKSVIVLEARNRLGGRTYTSRDFCDMPVEFGAELVHGSTIPTWELINRLGLRTIPWTKTDDSMVRLADGSWRTMSEARRLSPDFDATRTWKTLTSHPLPEDEPFESYLKRNGFTTDQLEYVRRMFGNSSGDAPSYNSAQAMVDEIRDHMPGEGDHRVLDGYDRLIEAQAKGLDIRFGSVVEAIDWSQNMIRVYTSDTTFEGEQVVVTLPVGVLQSGRVRFSPELPPEKRTALNKLHMGPGIKMMYRFDEPIQPPNIMAVYSASNPPMWWSPSVGQNKPYQIWTAFATGDWARELLAYSEQEALTKGLNALRKEVDLPNLKPSNQCLMNWPAEEFTLGAYSVAAPGGSGARLELAKSVQRRLYWAGEATVHNAWAATVHGAYVSGQRAAKEILAHL